MDEGSTRIWHGVHTALSTGYLGFGHCMNRNEWRLGTEKLREIQRNSVPTFTDLHFYYDKPSYTD
jgi:hypothetical protein